MLARVLLIAAAALLGVVQPALAPLTLSYVESSSGLGTPEWEAGNSELELADVNGDGHLDIVSIGDHSNPFGDPWAHGLIVYFGNGAGAWTNSMYGEFGYGGVAVGDVNNDGLQDVGYGMHHNYSGVDLGDQLIEVALGDGTGLSWTAWDDGLATNGEDWGMFDTDFADVDNDGDLDLGSISFGCCAGIHVYLNQGDGTWVQSYGFLGGNTDHGVAFGDVNADGFSDFVAGLQNGTVYLGDGSGGFSHADGNLPGGGSSGRAGPDLGDVNDDGRDDLSWCNTSGGVEVWTWTEGNVWVELSGTLPSSGTCELTQLRDMDVDGHGDVVSFGYGSAKIWTGDGMGGWTLAATITTPSPGYFSAFRAGGDADHNGYPDIALVAEQGSWPSGQNYLRFYREASVPSALSVAPVYPLGGETLYAGSVRFLDWVSGVPGSMASSVAVELSVAGASGPWLPVAAGLPNNGRYQWLLPGDVPNTADAYLRFTVTAESGSATSVTPAPFTIAGGSDLPTLHVDAIKMAGRTLGAGYRAKAAVRLRDVAGDVVPGAWVTLEVTLPSGGVRTREVLTDGRGVAQALWSSTAGGAWQVCVLDVHHAGYLYDPDQNVVTCDGLVYP
ncbi:MAG TPA: VCBS repeat-containing protein [Anaerolineae bacterium]|nr:VCBS repeat-containing protein [Anaerolineae bacterium]